MNDEERLALRTELATMRTSGARRQDLSQHACKRLFFDFGIRPSMATVRDLTQTGSASDIPKDIDAFWARIRSASRVRIEGGALPEGLQERAGELLGQLFQEAQRFAIQSLEAERHAAKDDVDAALSRLRDAEVRCATVDEALCRSEARAEAALARNSALEIELGSFRGRELEAQNGLQASIHRLESEHAALTQRLETEQTANAALRDRVDALNTELRHNTEHYAQQIKDAISEAERRVKPMLVELDSLRGMAATYQAGVRQASQKEFDFIQQLSIAKARADRLELRIREQSDEIDALALERDALLGQSGMSENVARLICAMIEEGRLSTQEIRALGTDIDGFVAVPAHCPTCVTGEPELAQHGDEFELSCPDCDRSSGAASSRLLAVARFHSANMVDASEQTER
ncbi:DNA-binding protein [Caballeronia mineralivorans PML1(12)]|uniref:DNA-binding protein n=1 Tax=Caballeronia mineralivorans PML1(12) TaxID=908627 RepID=A0A0J1CYA0_9BURK|nr:DNA-binding protein [Caballeronia mineralivorans]KLU25544.1 DNA-binding protein [Caballeronia mineralivorans PML1(12)]